ncbi:MULTISPECIES: tRNA pseudouridine(13) synthase TruD [unclassified Moraxella]|uniref:tRNA pseudouridine(13) synthase TruD n=1 Tax=unclassified Moraxella TaxID=2685852 RepID=UPI003AF951AB
MKQHPQTYMPSIQHAIYKATPQDFIVNEIMDIEFTDEGEHLWLQLQKTNLNTAYLAKLLANWANIPVKDVGYSGLKDRLAVTSQWFSLRLPTKTLPKTDLAEYLTAQLQEGENIQILAQHWHNKKLNRGTHKANQFIITLRDVVGEKADIENQLNLIKKQGVPNYFGEQRFGHEDNNVNFALELFSTGKINGKKPHPKFDRDKISLYLSSARSELFNAILAKRVSDNTWQTPLTGEVFNLDGSHSVFVAEVDEAILQRLATADIHLTGAMWGEGELKSHSEVGTLEKQVIDSEEKYQQLAQGLAQYGLKQQRRPLRLLPQDLNWQWLAEDTFQLDFTLPTGSFATAVLAGLGHIS